MDIRNPRSYGSGRFFSAFGSFISPLSFSDGREIRMITARKIARIANEAMQNRPKIRAKKPNSGQINPAATIAPRNIRTMPHAKILELIGVGFSSIRFPTSHFFL